MTKFSIYAALFAAGMAVMAAAAVAQTDHSGHAVSAAQDAPAVSAASSAYMAAMDKMDADMKAMAMTGKPGADFAAMMIPHHQSAIDMAEAYLVSGENDPELTQLSREIVAAQLREIAFLKTWLAKQPR